MAESVSVSALKAHLSHYLKLVQRGGEVVVRDRGKPVARLVGLDRLSSETTDERLDRLEARGILRRGSGDFSWLFAESPIVAPAAELRRAIDEDRGER